MMFATVVCDSSKQVYFQFAANTAYAPIHNKFKQTKMAITTHNVFFSSTLRQTIGTTITNGIHARHYYHHTRGQIWVKSAFYITSNIQLEMNVTTDGRYKQMRYLIELNKVIFYARSLNINLIFFYVRFKH